MYKVDTPTDTEELGIDQNYTEDSSDVFISPAAEGDFVRLQREWRTHELLQYVWEVMHTTIPITSTCAIFSRLPTGKDGEVIEPSIFR